MLKKIYNNLDNVTRLIDMYTTNNTENIMKEKEDDEEIMCNIRKLISLHLTK